MPHFDIKAKVSAFAVYRVKAANAEEAEQKWSADHPDCYCLDDCVPDETSGEELESITQLSPEHEARIELRRQRDDQARAGFKQLLLDTACHDVLKEFDAVVEANQDKALQRRDGHGAQ